MPYFSLNWITVTRFSLFKQVKKLWEYRSKNLKSKQVLNSAKTLNILTISIGKIPILSCDNYSTHGVTKHISKTPGELYINKFEMTENNRSEWIFSSA